MKLCTFHAMISLPNQDRQLCRKDFLIKYAKLKQTPLEKIEYNEYLRVLENGYTIQGVIVESDTVSVDTDEDLKYVRKLMSADELFEVYKP